MGKARSAPEENGSDPATLDQWSNLLSEAGGHTTVAVELLNERSGTTYSTYRSAKDKATKVELEKALA